MEVKRMPSCFYDDVLCIFYYPKYNLYLDIHDNIVNMNEIATSNDLYLFRLACKKPYDDHPTWWNFGHRMKKNVEVRMFCTDGEYFPKRLIA